MHLNRKRPFSLIDERKQNSISKGEQMLEKSHNVCGRKVYGINKRTVGANGVPGFLSVQQAQKHIRDSLLFEFLCNSAVGWLVETTAPGPRFSSLVLPRRTAQDGFVEREQPINVAISRATGRCCRLSKPDARSHSGEFIDKFGNYFRGP